MSKDNELNEILNSIKNNNASAENKFEFKTADDFKLPNKEPVIEEKPKQELLEFDKAESKPSKPKEIAPPTPKGELGDSDALDRQLENLVWFESQKDDAEPKKTKKSKEKSTVDFNKIKESLFAQKEKFAEKKSKREKKNPEDIKNQLKNIGSKALEVCKRKQFYIPVIAVALAIGMIFGGVKIYDYSKVAYLKPYEEKYSITYPEGISEKFCDMYGKNQYTAGSVEIPDTSTKKYVFSKAQNDSPYIEQHISLKRDYQNMAIYLNRDYADLEGSYSTAENYLDSQQIVKFSTLFNDYTYKVVAAFYTNTVAEDDAGYIFPYNVCGTMTDKSFEAYKDRIQSRRLYDTGYNLQKSNHFLTLSVDSDFMDNFRFVIVCVRVGEDEKFEKSTTAVVNEKVHYPQAWYDKNNQENPYRFASKWYPELYTFKSSPKTTKQSIEDYE